MRSLAGARELIEHTGGVLPFDVVSHAVAIGRLVAIVGALLTVASEQEARLDRIEERIGETLGMGG